MDLALVSRLPKAVLHDHLDGGPRVETVIELAEQGHYGDLPADDPDLLAAWFHQGRSGSLERYLEAFVHTVGVMQTAQALRRVAYESAVDLADDGVVYAEVRFGPSLHTQRGMSREETIEAVLDGLAAARAETGIAVYAIVTALRQDDDSEDVVRAAERFLGRGVIAFDLAGPEKGYPNDLHLAACRLARERGFGITLHAGEGDGPHSIWRSLAICAAQRIGHGVRIADDTVAVDGEITSLGPLAQRVRYHRVPLELAMTSNVDTGVVPDVPSHPLGRLYRAGFNVTINTDDQLMSGTSMSGEFALAANAHAMSLDDLEAITVATIEAGFGPWDERRRIIEERVRPGYAAARATP